MEKDADKLALDIDRLRSAFKSRGRDPGKIVVRAAAPYVFRDDRSCDPDATIAKIPAMAQAGVTMIEFHPVWFAKGVADFGTVLDAMVFVR